MAIFGAQGIRDAMTNAYRTHVRALEGQAIPDGTSLHEAAMYGALATRYAAGSTPRPESMIWAELAPFVRLPPEEGLDALAEYVVFKEMRSFADVVMLSVCVRRGLSLLSGEERDTYGLLSEAGGFEWSVLT